MDNDRTLFPVGETQPAPAVPQGKPRLQLADRHQVEMHCEHLDTMVPDDHPVRIIWGFIESSDLSALTTEIRATEDRPGRPPIDPKILMALWLYATIDGIGSARALEKLCEDHLIYRWICGGVSVNYHTLADFRAGLGQCLDDLLTEMVATLLSKKLLTLNRVAHDGMRVRAAAGSGSFRRFDTLSKALADAEAQVLALKAELHCDPAGSDNRRKAARQRAAEERMEKIQAALKQYPDVKKRKAMTEKTRACRRRMQTHGRCGWRTADSAQHTIFRFRRTLPLRSCWTLR